MGSCLRYLISTIRDQSVDTDSLYLHYSFDKRLLELIQSADIAVIISVEHLCSKCHSRDARYVFRSRTKTFLLSASELYGHYPHTVANVEKSASLGTVDLVLACAHQIYLHLRGIDDSLSESLDRINMKIAFGTFFLYQSSRLSNWLDSPYLIVGVHY